jgi:hypothetical protein
MGYITWVLQRTLPEFKGVIYFDPDTGHPYTYEIIQKKVYLPMKEKPNVDYENACLPMEEKPSVVHKNMIKLPERFCQFAKMGGNYLFPYFSNGPLKNHYRADINLLLENFPTWESIKENDDLSKNEWDETKHNLFKECLEWCAKQGGFSGLWPW